MSEPTALVISDAHLGATPPDRAERLLSFLESVPDRADELLVNGDLFDFWFEWREVILREHFPVLRSLAGLVEAGVRVRMVGGNHDAWAGDFLTGEIGVEWMEGPSRIRLGGRRAYVAHGDGMAPGDWSYRILKAVVRSRPAEALFRLVHPDLARRLIRSVSRTGREVRHGPLPHRADVLSDHAVEILRREHDLDLVIFGHAHRPELRPVSGDRHYLNPGDWINHFTYGRVTPDEVRLREWDGAPSGPGPQPPPRGTR
jgi:UDP-2,3-diacylglucosamine hydrolase